MLQKIFDYESITYNRQGQFLVKPRSKHWIGEHPPNTQFDTGSLDYLGNKLRLLKNGVYYEYQCTLLFDEQRITPSE